MHSQKNIKKVYIYIIYATFSNTKDPCNLPRMYLAHVCQILTTASDYFPIQDYLAVLHSEHKVWDLCRGSSSKRGAGLQPSGISHLWIFKFLAAMLPQIQVFWGIVLRTSVRNSQKFQRQ